MKIADVLYYNDDEEKWIFTNKELYTAYRSFTFTCLLVDLKDDSDKQLNAVLHLPFEPGKWVKDIYLHNMIAPVVYQIMERCPNVKMADFCCENDEDSTNIWAYFSHVLMDNTIWKLESLLTLYKKKLQFLCYYS